MKQLYIDIGSSTVKVYANEPKGDKVELLETKSFHFKQDFDPQLGITEQNKKALIEYICSVKQKYSNKRVKVYATAIFRKLSPAARTIWTDDFFRLTGLFFNIVPHDLEGHYLEKALSSEYKLAQPLLLINIGGGSTELVVMQGDRVINRYNLEIGVGSVLHDFPFINEATSKHKLEDVVASIKKQLPVISYAVPNAIYNGGELTYMKLVGYKLVPNKVFKDHDHPFCISKADFAAKNKEVFDAITLGRLESLMPEDPLWMHGARACSAIAQAIVEHFKVDKLIPSDSNMIHGVIKQELRTVVLSGSFRKHLDYIINIKRSLELKNVQVLSPRFDEPKNPGDEFVVFAGEEDLTPLELERHHLNMISECDALIVCSAKGYVGASALIEIGYAHALGKRIIFTEPPEEFLLKQLPAEVGV